MVDRDPARLVDVTPHRLDALGVDSYAAGEVCARQVSQLLNDVPTDVPRVAVAAMTWMDGFAVGVIAAKRAP